MKNVIGFVVLLVATPALALSVEEQHKAGEAAILGIVESEGVGYAAKDAVRSIKRGRTKDAARWAMCWCFEAGLDREHLGPEHDAGCHWFAALGESVRKTIEYGDERTIRFCSDRP